MTVSKETTQSNQVDEMEVARRVGETMMSNDKAAQALGIKLLEIRPGYSKMSMVVRKDMLNGLDICHGGMTFALADTAFAYSCNSRNRKTVALHCTINYAASSLEGDELTAVAEEKSLAGRTGIYDITISNQQGKSVAHFRGTSYGTSGTVY
ncbi:MAG TPA: hydroxyphenylacetyl-CoA thioesterase PaaI [Drouetiella sp.]